MRVGWLDFREGCLLGHLDGSWKGRDDATMAVSVAGYAAARRRSAERDSIRDGSTVGCFVEIDEGILLGK